MPVVIGTRQVNVGALPARLPIQASSSASKPAQPSGFSLRNVMAARAIDAQRKAAAARLASQQSKPSTSKPSAQVGSSKPIIQSSPVQKPQPKPQVQAQPTVVAKDGGRWTPPTQSSASFQNLQRQSLVEKTVTGQGTMTRGPIPQGLAVGQHKPLPRSLPQGVPFQRQAVAIDGTRTQPTTQQARTTVVQKPTAVFPTSPMQTVATPSPMPSMMPSITTRSATPSPAPADLTSPATAAPVRAPALIAPPAVRAGGGPVESMMPGKAAGGGAPKATAPAVAAAPAKAGPNYLLWGGAVLAGALLLSMAMK